jgi:hypothetical protein
MNYILIDFVLQQRSDSPIRYNSGRCNGKDSPTTVIVSPGDHIKEEYMLPTDDDYLPTHSPHVVSDE